MHRLRIIHCRWISACMRMDGAHSPALCALSGTHLAEAVCTWRPQVWRDNAEDGGREEAKQGGRRGCLGHQANCTQVEDHQKPESPDAPDETARKIGARRSLMPSTCANTACTDATPPNALSCARHRPDRTNRRRPPRAETSERNAIPTC